MKKMLTIAAVTLFGIAGAYAQQVKPVDQNPTKVTAVAAPVATTTELETAAKAETKKEAAKACDSKEKKSCGTKASGKKSCCSSKSDAPKGGN